MYGISTHTDEIEELNSSQEEADTRLVLHCLHHASHLSENNTIVVRSPDTDVFVLLLRFTQLVKQRVLFDTGVGNKRRLLDIHGIIAEVGTQLCLALPALHAFIGCDSTSAFVRRGKVTPLKLLQKHPEFTDTFMQLGLSPSVEPQLFEDLEHFVCLMYRSTSTSITDINKLRMELFLQKFSPKSGELLSSYNGADLSILPSRRPSGLRKTNLLYNSLAHRTTWLRSDLTHMVYRPPLEQVSYIIDGNAILHMQTALPNTFADLAESLYHQMPKAERVDFVTNTYHPLSIKTNERQRRGTTNTYLIKGPLTNVPRDWKQFLSNDVNKTQL